MAYSSFPFHDKIKLKHDNFSCFAFLSILILLLLFRTDLKAWQGTPKEEPTQSKQNFPNLLEQSLFNQKLLGQGNFQGSSSFKGEFENCIRFPYDFHSSSLFHIKKLAKTIAL